MLETPATQGRPATAAALATIAVALAWRALLAARAKLLGTPGQEHRQRVTAALVATALIGAVLLTGETTPPAGPLAGADLGSVFAARLAAAGIAGDAGGAGAGTVPAPGSAEAAGAADGQYAADGTLLKPGLGWAGSGPAPAFSVRIYTVRAGDTLTGIAARFGLSMMTLWWANDFTSKDSLRVGQRIIVPPVSGLLWLVREGDTIDSIAAQTRADPTDIRRFNELTSDTLLIGQLLMIPGGVGAPIPTPIPTPVPTARPTARPTAPPTPAPTPSPTPTPIEPIASYTGIASWMSVDGLAARLTAGTLVRVCGAGGCIQRRVTDWGPADTSRLVDLYSADFTVVCGCDLSVGLTEVRLDILPG